MDPKEVSELLLQNGREETSLTGFLPHVSSVVQNKMVAKRKTKNLP